MLVLLVQLIALERAGFRTSVALTSIYLKCLTFIRFSDKMLFSNIKGTILWIRKEQVSEVCELH